MKKNIVKSLCLLSVLLLIFSSHIYAMSRYDFDSGMKKGIEYFDKQMYYEARDEFQWFCDYNWGQMSAGQQKYALDYLGADKARVAELEKAAKSMSQQEFDAGMQKGIDYFNNEMYVEASDEFQWFCDYNWGKMNKAQQKYALDYLGASYDKYSEYVPMYAVHDGYVNEIYEVGHHIKEKQNEGWSLTIPKPKYSTNDATIREKTLEYFKSFIPRPSTLELYSTEITDLSDDYDREYGYVYKQVVFDGSFQNGFGGYTRDNYYIYVFFNGHTSDYSISGLK